MNTFLLLLKTIGVIVFTTLLATNLIGLFIRTLYQRINIDRLRRGDDNPYMKEIIDEFAPKKNVNFIAFLFGLFILVALFLYYKYFGLLIAIALLLMMVFRIPDLVDSIHGRNPDKKNYFLTFLAWIPIVLIIWNYFF